MEQETSNVEDRESCQPGRQQAEARGPGAIGLDDHELDPMRRGGLRGRVAGVALIDVGQLDMRAGGFLRGGGQRLHLGAVLLVGWHAHQRQQMTHGIGGRMHLRALVPLVPVVASPRVSLGGRMHRATIQQARGG